MDTPRNYYPIISLPIGSAYIATILGPLFRQRWHWVKDRSALCLEDLRECPHCPGETKNYGYLHAFGAFVEDGQACTGELILCLTPRTADEIQRHGGNMAGQVLKFIRKSTFARVRIEVADEPGAVELPAAPLDVKAHLFKCHGVSLRQPTPANDQPPDVLPFRRAN